MARLVYVKDDVVQDKPGKGFDPILRSDWHLEDITDTAKDMGVRLSKKKALEVMENIARYFDAETGINWDVIRSTIDTVKGR
jgi:hypothetical protein